MGILALSTPDLCPLTNQTPGTHDGSIMEDLSSLRPSALAQFISDVDSRRGPAPADYCLLDAWFLEVHARFQRGELSAGDIQHFRHAFGEAMTPATLQGFVCAKPHGYAGDFEIIDRIYTHHVSPDDRFACWDHYFHYHAGPKAVRNRKTYFHRLIANHAERTGFGPLDVLIVGSGPGRDICEHFAAHPDSGAHFDCIEIDPKAIAHAERLNEPYIDRVRFLQQNALRFRPAKTYDVVWAAGIFDYFSDRVFQSLLSRLYPAVRDDGELVIGNFATTNPSRAYMEFGDWCLNHRDGGHLSELAIESGIPGERVHVDTEPENVNLFLHIRNGQ